MSMRKAINDMCKACIYHGLGLYDPEPGNGNWRQQVEACTAQNCPLYGYRPKSRPERAKKTENRPVFDKN